VSAPPRGGAGAKVCGPVLDRELVLELLAGAEFLRAFSEWISEGATGLPLLLQQAAARRSELGLFITTAG